MASEKQVLEWSGNVPLVLGVLSIIPLSLAFRYWGASSIIPDSLYRFALVTKCMGFFSYNNTPEPSRTSSFFHVQLSRMPNEPVFYIPPAQYNPNYIFNHFSKFFQKYLNNIDVYTVDATQIDPNSKFDSIFDFTDCINFPKFSKPSLIVVSIPSPVGSRRPSGHMWTHALTIFVSPWKQEIRINDPMYNNTTDEGDFVRFPPELIRVIEKQFPEYKIIDEKKQLQNRGESICSYLAYKMGQYYAQGNIEELTREKIISDWAEDMILCKPAELPRSDQLFWLMHNIFAHIKEKFRTWTLKKFGQVLEDANCNSVLYLADNVRDGILQFAEGDDSVIESSLSSLTDCWVYFDSTYAISEINESGETLVDAIVSILQEHVLAQPQDALNQTLKTIHKDKDLVKKICDQLITTRLLHSPSAGPFK